MREANILNTLFELTKATPYAATTEELVGQEELAEVGRQRRKASERQLELNRKRKYERSLIEQAKKGRAL